MLIAATSLSACINVPPIFGIFLCHVCRNLRLGSNRIAEKCLQLARIAASAIASLPFIKTLSIIYHPFRLFFNSNYNIGAYGCTKFTAYAFLLLRNLRRVKALCVKPVGCHVYNLFRTNRGAQLTAFAPVLVECYSCHKYICSFHMADVTVYKPAQNAGKSLLHISSGIVESEGFLRGNFSQ